MKVGFIYASTLTVLLAFPGIESIDTASCLEACHCVREYDPICVSNGKTYSNICELECARRCDPCLKVLYKGACKGCCRRMAELSTTANPSHSSEEHGEILSTPVPSFSSEEQEGNFSTLQPPGSQEVNDGNLVTQQPSGASGEHDGTFTTQLPIV